MPAEITENFMPTKSNRNSNLPSWFAATPWMQMGTALRVAGKNVPTVLLVLARNARLFFTELGSPAQTYRRFG
jgi:hypothetical protein